MSPNPTVENTVTVKYVAPTLFIGWVKLSAWFTDHVVAGSENQSSKGIPTSMASTGLHSWER
jgi:hypothetical protein